MPEPHESNASFPPGIFVTRKDLVPSSRLIELLVDARSSYAWPAGQTAFVSQQTIRALEVQGMAYAVAPSPVLAHSLATTVSLWAGNNDPAHRAILAYTPIQIQTLDVTYRAALAGRIVDSISAMVNLPGISVVIASKMIRFLAPITSGAVDRHASYFTNSLSWSHPDVGFTTNFRREWSSATHRSSRLAVYTPARAREAIEEYVHRYLPLLSGLSASMNASDCLFIDAVSAVRTRWSAADVEMAMYAWWAENGAR